MVNASVFKSELGKTYIISLIKDPYENKKDKLHPRTPDWATMSTLILEFSR